MFSSVRRVLGNVRVVQTESVVTVEGLDTRVMLNDIQRIWKTSRIGKHLFTQVGRSSFSIPVFFAPDLVYILDTALNEKRRGTSVRTLTKLRNLLLSETWLASTQEPQPDRLDMRQLNNFTLKPLPPQQRYLEHYNTMPSQYHLNGDLLAGTAGSGKTALSLMVAECLASDVVVIISPKQAVDEVWVKNIERVFKKPQTYWVYSHGKPYKKQRFVIGHYEALGELVKMAHSFKRGKVTLILDESHNLNDISSQRTQLYLQLVKALDVTDVIHASGTPLKALGSEAIPLLRAIDPYFTQDAEERFKKIFGRDGNRGLDILRHRIGRMSFKIEKHELGLAKPVMRQVKVKIPNGKDYTLDAIRADMQKFIEERYKYYKGRRKEDQAFYDQCLDYYAKSIKGKKAKEKELQEYFQNVKTIQKAGGDTRVVGEEIKATNAFEKKEIHPVLPQKWRNQFKDVKSIIKYLNLKIQGEALGRVLGRKRIQCHVDMVPHVDFRGICESTTKKTIMFTSFVEALERAEKALPDQNLSPLVVYGKTNNELQAIVKTFRDNEDANPLLATYQSLSTAIPLVMADTVILLNSPFRAYIQEQAISRVHRLDADTQVTVHMTSLDTGNEPNISTRSDDILGWSQDMVSSIMGIENPFSIDQRGVSLEAQHDPEFDDHRLMKDALSTALEVYDLTVSDEDFTIPKPRRASHNPQPSYLEW